MKVKFIDHKREPKCAPNPKYPNGMDVDLSDGAKATCKTNIPYPAPRCGIMVVECEKCGLKVGLTVAGRIDDPKSVTLACWAHRLDETANHS